MYPALIPARGGSKGVPKKNIISLGTLPLIARNIISLLNSSAVSVVYVSTDDPTIAEVAAEYGGIAIQRPSEISQDTSSTDQVIAHFLKYLALNNEHCEWFFLSQATYPFLASSHVDLLNTSMVKNPGHDSYIAAASFHSFIWQETEEVSGRFEVANRGEHFSNRLRRQECQPQFIELGSVYLISHEGFVQSGSRFGLNPIPVCIPNAPILEIDTFTDLDHARLLEPMYRSTLTKLPKLNEINLVAIDFDGVLTDNHVFSDSTGQELIRSSKADSLAIKHIVSHLGIKVIIVTSELSASHLHRARKLGLEIFQILGGKGDFISEYLSLENKKNQCDIKMLYVGNDTNDLSVRPYADIFACPCDSHPEVIRASDIILFSSGGAGVMRELLNLLLNARAS